VAQLMPCKRKTTREEKTKNDEENEKEVKSR
jgi:hypothetical protein